MFKKFFVKTTIEKKKERNRNNDRDRFLLLRDNYNVRLSTFENGWVYETKPEKLASLGFYCGNKQKLVFCCKCGLGIECWKDVQDLLGIHKDLSGKCLCDV